VRGLLLCFEFFSCLLTFAHRQHSTAHSANEQRIGAPSALLVEGF
jgi:hypothetical protein